jgi:hypothetical protein
MFGYFFGFRNPDSVLNRNILFFEGPAPLPHFMEWPISSECATDVYVSNKMIFTYKYR